MHNHDCAFGESCSNETGYFEEDGPTYIPLISPSGVMGTIDIASGVLVVGGSIISTEPELSYPQEVTIVTGAGRLRRAIQRVVRAAPLRKLVGAFAKVASVVAPVLPAPYRQAVSSAASVANVASRIGRGDPATRQSVSDLARVALDTANPQSTRAREVLGQLNGMLRGQVPPLAAQGFAAARAAENLASRLASGDSSAIAAATTLAANARTNPAARLSLNTLRAAYRQLGGTSGFSENLERGAQILWGTIRPRVGVRTSAEMDTPRDKYVRGVSLALDVAHR